MRIGVFGGTFNPIHLGHTNLIQGFYENLSLDKVIIIPTNVPPHKNPDFLVDAQHRINMCKLALNELVYCEVSDIEIRRTGKSYTVDTLNELKSIFPNSELFLLMGEDMFLTVEKWKSSTDIFKLATICATPRTKDNILELEKHSKCLKSKYNFLKSKIINIPLVVVSSTEIRNGNTNLLDKKVLDYSKKNNLYDWSDLL